MKRGELGQIVRYDDELYEVIGHSDGRHILLAPIGRPPCPQCGSHGQVHLVEASRLFQERVQPVKTIGE